MDTVILQVPHPGPAAPPPVRDAFPDEIEEAERAVEACPFKLGGPGNMDLLFAIAERLGAERVVETGVANGWSSLALLLSLQHRSSAKLVSVDLPYLQHQNDDWIGTAVPARLRTRWEVLKMPDRRGIPKALELLGTIDLAHYDSDKSYGGRRWAYPRLWDALRPGGVLISDDIGDNLAFADFANDTGARCLVIADGEKYQGVLVKQELT